MRKNKMGKRAKSSTSKKMDFRTIEKDYQKMPAKMGVALNKEIALAKQQAAKLKGAIKQSQALVDKLANKVSKTASAKVKKALTKATKVFNQLTKQQQAHGKTLATLNNQKDKIQALRKHISQFEKDWTKNLKVQVTRAAKPAKTKNVAVNEQATVETKDTMIDNDRPNEITELAS